MNASRRRWPMWLLLGLIVLPVLEIVLLIAIGRTVGWLPTVAALILVTVAGSWLLRREGPRTWSSLKAAVSGVDVGDGVTVRRAPYAPTRELSDGALVLFGAILLLLPGFLTDILAIICLLPATRSLPRALFAQFVRNRAQRVVGATRAPVRSSTHFDATPSTDSSPDSPITPSRIIEPPRP